MDEAGPAGDDMKRSLCLSVPDPRRTILRTGLLVTFNFVLIALTAGCNLQNAQVKSGDNGSNGSGPKTERAPGRANPTSDAAVSDPGPAIVLPDGGIDAMDVAPANSCPTVSPSDDKDLDGFTVAQGDCNDCDKAVNPGAFDVPANKVDEDCNGTADDEPADCEAGLPLDGDATAAAKAIGICRVASGGVPGQPSATGNPRAWGLLKASYVFPDGSTASLAGAGGFLGIGGTCGKAGTPPNPLSHGVLPLFGKMLKPRRGPAMAALSSGIARSGVTDIQPFGESPSSAEMCTRSRAPMGFPVSSEPTCGDTRSLGISDATDANDGIALELVLRVPTNASALSFDFNFHTYEYSDYICSEYNDHFVVLLKSKAPDLPANQNIAFDSQSNPVSVNNGFVEVCDPFTYRGRKNGVPFTRQFPCKLGNGELDGTGFEEHAATGWLQTRANVVPGEEVTLRFAIWDAGDAVLDSTVLLDNFTWDAKPGSNVTMRAPPVVE
jgi:hypothetical protein